MKRIITTSPPCHRRRFNKNIIVLFVVIVVMIYIFVSQVRTSFDDSLIVEHSQQQKQQQQQQFTTPVMVFDDYPYHPYEKKNVPSNINELNNRTNISMILSQKEQQENHLHPLTILLLSNNNDNNNLPNNDIILFELGTKSQYHGLGSLTMNILLFKMYFEEKDQHRRKLVVDQTSLINYRYNSSKGLYSGWFQISTFPVLDNTQIDLQRVQQELQKRNQSFLDWKNPIPYYNSPLLFSSRNNNTSNKIIKISHKTQREWKLGFMAARKHARIYYGLALKQSDVLNWKLKKNSTFFYKLTSTFCTSIKFTSQALHHINELLANNNTSIIPNNSLLMSSSGHRHYLPSSSKNSSSSPATTTTTATTIISVAFHIRQGDKISATNHNWRLHNINEYVTKFLRVFRENGNDNDNSPPTSLFSIKHCFVATDKPTEVIPALKEALLNASIPCQLHTLATTTTHDDHHESNGNDNDIDDRRRFSSTLRFMAELRLMVEATYFVGTFASNVARLVTLWRGCNVYKKHIDDPNKFTNYHSHSYGIDTEYWTM